MIPFGVWTRSGWKQASIVSRLPHGTIIHSCPFSFFCSITHFSFYLLTSNSHKINQTHHFIVCSVYPRELFDIYEIAKMMRMVNQVMKYHVDIKNEQIWLMTLALILQSTVFQVLEVEFVFVYIYIYSCGHVFQSSVPKLEDIISVLIYQYSFTSSPSSLFFVLTFENQCIFWLNIPIIL